MKSEHAKRGLQYCRWGDCGTIEGGVFAPPKTCLEKKCRGGPFNKAPLCEQFLPLLTPAEQGKSDSLFTRVAGGKRF